MKINYMQWAGGAICLFIGSLMLIAPHQFNFVGAIMLPQHLFYWGFVFLIAGSSLFVVSVITPPRWISILIHLFSGVLILLQSVSYILSQAWISSLTYGFLGLGIILAGWLPSSDEKESDHRQGDLFSLLIGINNIVTGLLLLLIHARPLSNPDFQLQPAQLLYFGIAFLIAGLILTILQLRQMLVPLTQERLYNEGSLSQKIFISLAYLLSTLVFFAFLIIAALPTRIWVATAYYGGIGLGLGILPWLPARYQRIEPNSLSTRLILVVALAATLPLILSISLVSQQVERQARYDAMERQKVIAENTASMIGESIKSHQSALQAMASVPGLVDAATEEQHDWLSTFSKAYPEVITFNLYDAEGQLLASSNPTTEPDTLAGIPFFDEARQRREPTMDVFFSPALQMPVFTFTQPILEDETFSGLVTFQLGADYLSNFFKNQTSGFGTVYLVDNQGRVVAHPEEEIMLGFTSLSELPPVKESLAGAETSGSISYFSNRVERLASYSEVPGPLWAVIVDRPMSDVLFGLYFGRDLAFGILLLFLALTIPTGAFIANRIIIRLDSLGKVVSEVASGKPGAPLPHSRFIEFDRLAQAFNKMNTNLQRRTSEREQALRSLQEAKAELEDRVAARTIELSQLNARLLETNAELEHAKLNLEYELAEHERMDKMLQQANQRLNEILESISDDFLALDENWNFTYANLRFAFSGGFSPRDLIGCNFWEKFPHFTGTRLEKKFRQVMKTRKPAHFEFNDQQTDRWLAISVYPSPEGISAYWLDTTETKLSERLQAELLAENRLVRELLERVVWEVPAGLCILAGHDFRYEMVNPAYEAISSGKGNIIGHPFAEVWPEFSDVILPMLESVYRSGSPYHVIDLPLRLKGENGLEERFFTLSFTPLMDEYGNVDKILSLVQETTEQVHNRRQVENERALLEAIFHSAPEGIVVADSEGRILMTNPTADNLYRRQMPYEQSYETHTQFRLCYPDGTPYDPRDLPLTRAALDGELFSEVEMLIVWPDEQVRYLLVNAAPVYGQEDEITGAVGIFQDITDRKKAGAALEEYALQLEQINRELESANRELADFAFMASHDLQEPLRKVQAFGERLRDVAGKQLTKESMDYLNRMEQSAARMSEMLEALLMYSRVTTRGKPRQAVNLNEIITEVINDLELSMERSQGTVDVDVLPVIHADYFQIRQLMQNLLSNALKFHRPGLPPHIKIYSQTSLEQDMVEIYVEDNGIGFDERYLNRLFQPFQRLVGRSQYRGHGMGLAICRKIVERHGGSITARSTPGEGSTFIFRLPVDELEVK